MIIKNLLYIFQTENYNLGRFLRFSYSHYQWWRLAQRHSIIWTSKAKLLYVVTVVLLLAIVAMTIILFGWVGGVSAVLLVLGLPLIIGLANMLIYPVDYYLKKKLIEKATAIIQANKDHLTVVGITGSYGKTSTKEILAKILDQKFRVLITEGNINTDVGVADFIIKQAEILKNKDIFIVEMGAYAQGEITQICQIVKPEYSILTGINEAHLERFGSLDQIISTKFELPENTTRMTVLNFDDSNIKEKYQKFKLANWQGTSAGKASQIKARDNFGGLSFQLGGATLTTKLLARHNVSLILLAIEIAKKLGLSEPEIISGVGRIEYVNHRLEPIYNAQTNIWVIDDSYNGNINGIISGLEVLSRAAGRKVVLTPGLVELGHKTAAVARNMAERYCQTVDLVLLIKSRSTVPMAAYFQEKGFQQYQMFASTAEAHQALSSILKSGDTIMFQNDLTDNYF